MTLHVRVGTHPSLHSTELSHSPFYSKYVTVVAVGRGEGVRVEVQPQILLPKKEAREGMAFVLGNCSGDLCSGLVVYILMTRPMRPCLCLCYLWDLVTSSGVAGSVGVRLPSCSSLCCRPAPAPAPFSELLTLVGESETCSWLPPARLGLANCLPIIINAAM